jgi:hypothetical protein
MRSYRDQGGSALIMLIGVIAVLLILSSTLVLSMANEGHSTSADRQETKAFSVAEAGVDAAMYSLASTWPGDQTIVPSVDEGAFRSSFDQTEFPDPSTGEFVDVKYYDDLIPVNTTVTWDSNGNDIMWVEAQGGVSNESSRIRTQVQKIQVSLTTFPSGCLIYSGGDARVRNLRYFGAPTGSPAKIYVNGSWSQSWLTFLDNVTVKQAPDPEVPASIDTYLPPAVVQSLVQAAQVAQPMGTEYNGLTITGGTHNYPGNTWIHGDLTISGVGHITFGNVYVDGNVHLSGASVLTFGSLFVTGNCSTDGVTFGHWGPTYVAGDATLSASGYIPMSIFVAGGNIAVSGVGYWGGDGVGTNLPPCIFMTVGSQKTLTWSGSGLYYGLMANIDGPIEMPGVGAVYGAIMAGDDVNGTGRAYDASGIAGGVYYDPNVVINLQAAGGTVVKIVPDTWQEVTPTGT